MPENTSTIRVIRLGNGKQYGLSAYARAWRACKASAPGTEFKHGLTGWAPESRETILKQFMDGLHDRINRHIPSFGRGRKWSSDWYWLMWRTSRDLNRPRLAIHWLPLELRARFAHRLSEF